MADVKLTHVPYNGTGPALTDLVGGHVSIYFSSLPSAIGLVNEGKVRALAVTGAQRSPLLPDLPTVAEAALPGFEAVLHYGIVASGRHAACDRRQAQRRAARGRHRARRQGAACRRRHRATASTPEEYAADIDREETKWSAIVKQVRRQGGIA